MTPLSARDRSGDVSALSPTGEAHRRATPSTVQLFVNPRPRRRTRRRIDALCHAFERCGVTILLTQSIAERLEIDPRADHVCSAGGDGTLRHVVDAVRRSGRAIPVSAFPAGTVNLLARECGYPRTAEAFVRRVLDDPNHRDHFIALVGDVPMLACASVGPDSHVVAAVSPALKSLIGRAAYLIAFCRLFLRWPRTEMMVTHGGRQLRCEAIYIAKGRYFAGPWSFAPGASVLEPLLHVVALRRASRWRFFRFACLLVSKRRVDHLDGVECFSCAALTISSAGAAPIQADGDVVGWLPADIRVSADTMAFG